MMLRHLRSGMLVAAIAAACCIVHAPAAQAQQTDPNIQTLEKKLDELLRQAEELRGEIERLKQQNATEPSDDLTNVDVVPESNVPPAPSTDTPPPTTEATPAPQETADIQPIESGSDASASAKVFNPDMSVIGTFLGHAGDRNPFEYGEDEARGPIDIGEVEIALEAFVDPYAKGKFFLAIGEEGIEVEEGYAELLTLPWDLSAKVGKKKALFGKANTFHTHIRPWVDQPLVIHNFFGDEGLADTGVSVSKLFPNPYVYTELTGEVFSGNAEGIFERQTDNDLFYNTHLRLFRDLTENSNVEFGASYSRGTAASSGRTSDFTGVDVSYRWKPLQQGLYRGLIARFELLSNADRNLGERLYGYYASAEWRLAQRWIVGGRIDRADRGFSVTDEEGEGRFTDRGASLLLTFQPSEFSQLRGQLRRVRYGGARSVTEALLQFQFAIGAHGAHTF